MSKITHEFGPQFHSAGRCIMYLRSLESSMQDFLCINEAAKRKNDRVVQLYNVRCRHEMAIRVYEARLLKWSGKNLSKLIELFFEEWPEWQSDKRVSNAFKILEIHRYALSHHYRLSEIAYSSFHDRTKGLIRDTEFPIGKLRPWQSNCPFALLLPCLHEAFLKSFYEKIKMIDFACFRKVAEQLGIENYVGLLTGANWRLTEGVDPLTIAPTFATTSSGRESE